MPELRSIDWRFAARGRVDAQPGVVIVGIGNAAPQVSDFTPEELAASEALRLMTERPFPWNRKVFALLIDRLFEAGARAVALDFLFLSENEGDPDLRAALERHRGKVIIGWTIEEQGEEAGLREVGMRFPSPSVLPGESAEFSAFVFHHPDADGVLRHVDHRTSELREMGRDAQGGDLMGFAAMAVRQATGREAPAGFRRLINFQGGHQTYPHLPLEDVFVERVFRGSRQFEQGNVFRDKIVFVGPTANTFHDTMLTPFGEMAGVETHAQIAADLLAGTTLRDRRGGRLAHGAALRAAAGAGGAAGARRAGADGAAGGFGRCVLRRRAVALSSDAHRDPDDGAALRARRQRRFRHSVSMAARTIRARAAAQCAERSPLEKRGRRDPGPARFLRPGAARHVEESTTLFSDIRSFTTWSESVSPQELVEQLNEYFLAMVDAILTEDGTPQRFIGDAILAAWGDTHTHGEAEDATRAVRSALVMRSALVRLNDGWRGRTDRRELTAGIGINHGEVIVGEVGHPVRRQFTVMGDAINLAARLESATKQFHADILIGPTVEEMTRAEFVYRRVDLLVFKGKTQPVEVFIPLSDAATPPPAWLADYHRAIDLYRARSFAEAAELFATVNAAIGGDDFLCAMYAERCAGFVQTPPAAEWDGSHVLAEK